MIPVWTCYPTVVGVLYEAWTMCKRCEQPHVQQQDLQLCIRHSLVVQWFARLMSWTMLLSKCGMVQGQWYLCGYTTPQTLGYYMRHGQYVTGVDNPTENSKTFNYTRFTLWCYTDFRQILLEPCLPVTAQWSKDNDTCMDMLLYWLWIVIWGMDNVWEGLIIP